MGLRFRFRNQLIDIQRSVPHRFRQRQRLNDLRDFLHGTMRMRMRMIMMVIMVMVMVMVMVVIVIMVMVMIVVVVIMVMVVCVFMVMVMVVIVVMVMLMVVIVIVVIMVVVVMVIMNFFLLTVHENAKMRSDNAAFHGWLDRKANARQADGIHLADERILVVQKLIQSGGDHIARRAHSTIQIQRSHSLSR